MIVLQVKCPQLSKPEATAARNESFVRSLQVAKDIIFQSHMLNQTTQGNAPKKTPSKTCHKVTLPLNDTFNMDICQDGFLWEHI